MKRVLVVEPDPAVAQGLGTILSKRGFLVETTRTAESALEAYLEGRFAAVTTAFHLGSMNGVELARAIKAKSPDQAILLLSSAGFTAHSPADASLFWAQVRKPFAMVDLLRALDAACGGASGQPVP